MEMREMTLQNGLYDAAVYFIRKYHRRKVNRQMPATNIRTHTHTDAHSFGGMLAHTPDPSCSVIFGDVKYQRKYKQTVECRDLEGWCYARPVKSHHMARLKR